MQNLTHDLTGLFHLIAALFALIFGTIVLLDNKGTKRHRQVGYVYAVSMVVMLATSFMIYRLFNGFGLFHYFSILSTVTLAGGMIPVFRRRSPNWVDYHFSFMYWSVFGLYAAFVAEVLTRIPEQPFFRMLGIAIFAVMAFGYFFWFRNKKKWSNQFRVVGNNEEK